jgi:pyruvate,water dikinase
MVNAISGRVIYSRNPVSSLDDRIFINAVWGLPKSVVDGSVACDLFVTSRESPMPIIQKMISHKAQKFVCYPQEGICRINLTEEESARSCLTDDQTGKLSQIAVRIENHYALPQDIEWAVAGDGTIHILQCRPLKQSHAGETGAASLDPGIEKRHIIPLHLLDPDKTAARIRSTLQVLRNCRAFPRN